MTVLSRMQLSNKRKTKETSSAKTSRDDFELGTRDIREITPIECLGDGVYVANGKFCYMARIEGTNFSVMSDEQQNAREAALIAVINKIDCPVQFVTTSVVADTARVARVIATEAQEMPDGPLKTYAALYANALDKMRLEKQIMAQNSWLVITDNGTEGEPERRLKEKIDIICTSVRNAGVIATPVTSDPEVMDVLASILTAEAIMKPSDLVAAGAHSKLHLGMQEAVASVA
jgi:formylmethanofuran:tetrahydromethanopterin formyltransferase